MKQDTERQIFSGHRVAARDGASIGQKYDQGERENDKSRTRSQRAFDRAMREDRSQQRESQHRDDRGPSLLAFERTPAKIHRVAAGHEDREQVKRGDGAGRGRKLLSQPKIHKRRIDIPRAARVLKAIDSGDPLEKDRSD